MRAYSEDLRQKVVEAVERRGTSKPEAARLFGISLSSVKRYTRLASQGESLTPRKGGGRPPRSEEHTSELQSRQYLVCRLLLEKKTLHYEPSSPHSASRFVPQPPRRLRSQEQTCPLHSLNYLFFSFLFSSYQKHQ